MVPRPHIASMFCNSLGIVGVPGADRMPGFRRSQFQQFAFGKVAAIYQESPYKADISERDYKTDIIDGRVTGARPGQRIVVYAKTDGRWGLCRQTYQPFAKIESDGHWKAAVHLGLQYAALLVEPTYDPHEQTESLPIVGNQCGGADSRGGKGERPYSRRRRY